MNRTTLQKNVDNIELKCKELISEINQHLSIPQKADELYPPICQYSTNKQRINSEKSFKNKFYRNDSLITCHNEVITFLIDQNKYTASCFNTIAIPEEICHKLTKINQHLIDDTKSGFASNNSDSNAGSKLEAQCSNHVHIKPQLTKHVAFNLHLNSEKPSRIQNIGTYKFVHDDFENIQLHGQSEEDFFVKLNGNISTKTKQKLKDEGDQIQNDSENNDDDDVRAFLFGRNEKKRL